MELKKGLSENEILWKLQGSLDDDSLLEFENTVLNSEYHGEDLILDLSNAEILTSRGRRSLNWVVSSAQKRGAVVKILPPGSFQGPGMDRIVLC